MRGLMVRTLLFSVGCLLVLAAGATPAFAVSATPEIDAGSFGSAVTLLAGGYFVIKSKLFRK
jgi:hypothetical protein